MFITKDDSVYPFTELPATKGNEGVILIVRKAWELLNAVHVFGL